MNLIYRRNIMYPQQSVYVWLTKAAQQAIMDAFGMDGTAVIAATNEYLNGIAAQGQAGKAKATALAGFINEDPMMVCSLGLEPQGVTMPKRRITGSGNIDTLYAPNAKTNFIDEYYADGVPNNWVLTSNYTTWANQTTGYIHKSGHVYMFNGGTGQNAGRGYYDYRNPVENRDVVVEMTPTKYIYDGVDVNVGKGDNYSSSKKLTAKTTDKTARYRLWIKEEGVMLREFYPFITGKAWSADKVSTGVAQAKDTIGMIDVANGIFYPNAASSGAFTISYTRNGQPWTPPTP